MIYEGKICNITHDGLRKSLFNNNLIWCEYYVPSEIDDLEDFGENRQFLELHLINSKNSFDSEKTYYSWPEKHLKHRSIPEFSHVGAGVNFLGMSFSGFLWIVSGELTSISIFYKDSVIDFSLNEDFREENASELVDISKESHEDFVQVQICLNEHITKIIDLYQVQIPC